MLAPIDWHPSRQRRGWCVLIVVLGGLSLWLAALPWWLCGLLGVALLALFGWQWREHCPQQLAWRDGYLWLDQQPWRVVEQGRLYWPAWQLQLRSPLTGRARYFIVWPDSATGEALRKLRVALRVENSTQG